jgi:hypothetical protein
LKEDLEASKPGQLWNFSRYSKKNYARKLILNGKNNFFRMVQDNW